MSEVKKYPQYFNLFTIDKDYAYLIKDVDKSLNTFRGASKHFKELEKNTFIMAFDTSGELIAYQLYNSDAYYINELID